jgi:hypothetical protein
LPRQKSPRKRILLRFYHTECASRWR